MKNVFFILFLASILFSCGTSENMLPPAHKAPFTLDSIINSDINFKAADHILITDVKQVREFLRDIKQIPTGNTFNLRSRIRTITIRDPKMSELPPELVDFDHLSGLIIEDCPNLSLVSIDRYFRNLYDQYRGIYNRKELPAIYFLNSLTLRNVNKNTLSFENWPQLNGLVYLTELILDDVDNIEEHQLQYLLNHMSKLFPNLRYLALERLGLQDSINMNELVRYEASRYLYDAGDANYDATKLTEEMLNKVIPDTIRKAWIKKMKCNEKTNLCPLDFSGADLFALSLRKNELSKVPKLPFSLFSLDLSMNELETVDIKQIGQLDSLQYFLLHCNNLPYQELIKLSTLPKEFLLTLSLECNVDNDPTISNRDTISYLPREAERRAINTVFSNGVVKFINYGRRYESDFSEEPINCSRCWDWKYLPLIEGIWEYTDTTTGQVNYIEIKRERGTEDDQYFLIDKGNSYEISIDDLMLNEELVVRDQLVKRTLRGIISKKGDGPELDKSELRNYFQADVLDINNVSILFYQRQYYVKKQEEEPTIFELPIKR